MKLPEKKKNGIKKELKILLSLVLLSVTLISAYFLYPVQLWQNKGTDKEVKEHSEFFQNIIPKIISLTVELSYTKTVEPEIESEPEVRTVLVEIDELRRDYSNNDIVGFLKIEETNIFYPVAKADDNEFYLNRNLYGNKDSAGTIFMDFENSVEELNDNTIIYGHNMRDGSMFHNLRYYFDKQYYESHRYISLTTPYEETIWEIFAFYQTKTDFYYIQTSFENRDSYLSLLLQMKLKSIYDTGVYVDSNDKILTLSTCANEGGDNRYVLNAKLLKTGAAPLPPAKE